MTSTSPPVADPASAPQGALLLTDEVALPPLSAGAPPAVVAVTLDTLADWPALQSVPQPGMQPGLQPPPPDAAAARERAVLRRTLLLALLLHVWLVLLIGNVPPGTAEPGSGVGGVINVRLGGDVPGPQLDTPSRGVPRASGGEGTAVATRQGGAVRDRAPADDAPEGAARLGDWSPAVPDATRQDRLPAARAPRVAAAPEQEAGAPAPPGVVTDSTATPTLSAAAAPVPMPAPAALPRVEPAPAFAPELVPTPAAVPAPLAVLSPGTAAPPRPMSPLPATPMLPRPDLPDTALPAAAPLLPTLAAAPLSSTARPSTSAALPRIEQAQAPVSPLPLPPSAQAVPVPQAAPAKVLPSTLAIPSQRPATAAAALAPLSASPAPLPAPALSTAALPTPLAPNRALAVDQRLAAPVAPTAPLPTSLPLPQATPLPGPATAPLPALATLAAPEATTAVAAPPGQAASSAGSAAPTAPALAQPPASTPGVATARPAPDATTALPSPSAGPVPDVRPALTGPLPSGMGRGSADAGEQVGRDVATPPSASASSPRLNLDLPRSRGGELSSQGSRGVLQLMARPPEVKSKLATEIEKAGKADCAKAYAGAGLLAVVPLAVDALKKDGGCKW